MKHSPDCKTVIQGSQFGCDCGFSNTAFTNTPRAGESVCVHGTRRTLYCTKCATIARDVLVGPSAPDSCQVTKDRIGDHKARKQRPLCTGVLDYFPDALLEVAHCSWVGNEQHNPGQKLHWAKEKSIGEGNEILRHLIDRGARDSDGVRHLAKAAWRCLELLQREIDAEKKPSPWLTAKDRT